MTTALAVNDPLSFEEYRRNARHDTDLWAASDRGWAWVEGVQGPCFAHYLDYKGTSEPGRDGKWIHVVIVDRGVVWVRTCADARLAIRSAWRHYRKAGR